MQQVVEFDIDKKNLLKDIISKQTGSLNKAIKELFQNSFDAGATEIKVIVNSKSLRFIDNGCGMNKEEIDKYFRVFGTTEKRNNSKKTGAFGMGRGQIFNFGNILWKTQNCVMTVDIKKSLDYTFEETDKFMENINGTDIIISLYSEIYPWRISNTIFHIKHDVLPPTGVSIYLNGDLYKPDVKEFKDFSNDKYFVFTSNDHTSKIYNGGLAIRDIKTTNYKYSVMSYNKLDLNFARNELIEASQSTEDLLYFIYEIEELMASKKDRFNIEEAKNILRLLSAKKISLDSVYDKKIIPLSNEKLISFKDLIENPNMGVLFGGKNIWSDDCLRQDYRVISDKVQQEILRIKKNFLLNLDFLSKSTKELSRRGYHKKIDLSKLKKNVQYYYMCLELNEYIFEKTFEFDNDRYKRDIFLGLSDIANGWTDGHSEIMISRVFIEGLQNKEQAMLKLWKVLCHEYAHTRENTKEDHHNYQFYQEFEDMVSRSLPHLSHCMRYITRKFLKEKYSF